MAMGMNRCLFGLLVIPGLVVALSCATAAPAGEEPTPAARGDLPVALARAPAADQHPTVDARTSCQDCHRVTNLEVVLEWEQSLHAERGVGCFICHGEIGVDFRKQPGDASCVACHSATMGSLAHGPVDRCFSCHVPHRLAYP